MSEFATWVIGIAAVVLMLAYSIIFTAVINAKRRIQGAMGYSVRRHAASTRRAAH